MPRVRPWALRITLAAEEAEQPENPTLLDDGKGGIKLKDASDASDASWKQAEKQAEDMIIPCPDKDFSGYLHVVVWNEVGTCAQYVYKAETGKGSEADQPLAWLTAWTSKYQQWKDEQKNEQQEVTQKAGWYSPEGNGYEVIHDVVLASVDNIHVQNDLNVPTVTASAQDTTVLAAGVTYGWYNGYNNVLTSLETYKKCVGSTAPYTVSYELKRPDKKVINGSLPSKTLRKDDPGKDGLEAFGG